MPRVVLVTGVGRFIGLRVAAALAADPSIERVIGVDTVAPPEADRALLGRVEFVRADVRNPLLGTVLAQGSVDTVVHAGLTRNQRLRATVRGAAGSARSVGRAPSDQNVVAAMQLLAACQKSDTVQRLVVKSTTAVYGGTASGQSIFGEADPPPRRVRGAFAQDAVDVEAHVRGLARRRPDIRVLMLRLAHVLGPVIDTGLSRYLSSPVVPTPIGRDPRMQFLHEDDAVEVLSQSASAALGERTGVVNVAGDGVVLLSQVIRRGSRLRVPTLPRLLGPVGTAVGNQALAEVLASDPALLDAGRVVDTVSMRRDLGFTPRFTTAQTLESFLEAARPMPGFSRVGLGFGARVIRDRAAGRTPLVGGS